MNKKLATFISIGIIIILFVFLIIKKNQNNSLTSLNPHRGKIVEAVYGIGTVTASKSYQLKIGITSAIKKLHVIEGELVSAGQSMIDLADSTSFKAPFSGTITSIPYKTGETVFPQTPILTLIDLTNLYISVSLEQQGAMRVKTGQGVSLSFESLRGQKLEGKVRTIFPNEGQFIVHVDVPTLPKEILPGMTADVAISIDQKENALLVPVAAINNGKILIKRSGKEMKQDIKIGTVDGQWAEVISDNIQETDEVILKK